MRVLSFAFLLSWQAGAVSSSKKKSLVHFGNEVGLDPVSDLGAQRHGCAYLWDAMHVTVVEHLLWRVLSCNLSRNTV